MIRVGAALIALVLVVAGCSTTANGNAQWPIPQTAPSALEGMLLSPAEVSAAMGAEMSTVQTRAEFVRTRQLDDTRCQNAWAPADDDTYAGAPVSGAQIRTLQSPDTSNQRLVSEALISFKTIAAADEFIATSIDAWKVCQKRPVTITPPGGQPQQWAFGPLTLNDEKRYLTMTRTTNSGAVCQRVMAVRANVIADVAACGSEIVIGWPTTVINNQGVVIADRLSMKVPTTK